MITRQALTAALVGTAIVIGAGAGCAATDTRESPGQYTDSSVVTTKVKTALARDDVASLLDIEVDTFRDVVSLSGFVDTEAERLRAAEVAGTVEGVTRVENGLVVKPAS